MNVLITGSPSGQLFYELLRTAPAGATILDTRRGDSPRLDITDSAAVMKFVSEHKPEIIFNAAAYTAVDKAESDASAAHAVNTSAVQTLADAANSVGARLVQISTDFVFGCSDGHPFRVDAPTAPISVYGKTKQEAEQIVVATCPQNGSVIRTAWVYSSNGNNFVKTMLRLMNERGEVGVIADQIGAPTWAKRLAEAMWQTVDRKVPGIWHWTGAGACSWYDFAVAIAEEGKAAGLINSDVVVNPLRTDQYPTPATRPGYSVLELTKTWDAFELKAPHWREDLRLMLQELL